MLPTARTEVSITHNSDQYRITLVIPDGSERQLEVEGDEYILVAGFREGLELPHMCLQGWCLTCAGRVLGEGCWDQSHSRRYFDEDRQAGYILLCTARPCSDLKIQTHQRIAMRDHRIAEGLPAPRA